MAEAGWAEAGSTMYRLATAEYLAGTTRWNAAPMTRPARAAPSHSRRRRRTASFSTDRSTMGPKYSSSATASTGARPGPSGTGLAILLSALTGAAQMDGRGGGATGGFVDLLRCLFACQVVPLGYTSLVTGEAARASAGSTVGTPGSAIAAAAPSISVTGSTVAVAGTSAVRRDTQRTRPRAPQRTGRSRRRRPQPHQVRRPYGLKRPLPGCTAPAQEVTP